MTSDSVSAGSGRPFDFHSTNDTISRPRPSILQEADGIIHGQRQQDYGTPLQSFTRIAQFWSAVLGVEVTPTQVALCMIGLKMSRYIHGHQRDSLTDLIGYAGTIELMQQEEAELGITNRPLAPRPDRP